MRYTDQQRIEKIRELAAKLKEFIEFDNITKERILNEYPIQWAITTPLYNIGEHVYNLTDELKDRNDQIPWMKISGLRHRLVHN